MRLTPLILKKLKPAGALSLEEVAEPEAIIEEPVATESEGSALVTEGAASTDTIDGSEEETTELSAEESVVSEGR